MHQSVHLSTQKVHECINVSKWFGFTSVTNSRAKPQEPRRWKSMLIQQGWFTALYTQHYPVYPVTLLRLVPTLGLGTTWVRQTRSGSCHYPTAATKCNEQPSQATETPSVEKHAHPARVVYCAIYSTLSRLSRRTSV